MNAKESLKAITPQLIEELISGDHKFGTSYLEVDYESGSCGNVTEYETNQFEFENDEWWITVDYECTTNSGDLRGQVTGLSAFYYEEDMEYKIEGADLEELKAEINKALEDF